MILLFCFGSLSKGSVAPIHTSALPLSSLATSPKPSPEPKKLSRSQIIDRYAELDRQYRLIKPQLDERDALGKTIRSWAENEPAAALPIYKSSNFQVQVSARKNATMFDLVKIFLKLGRDKFLSIVEIGKDKLKEAYPTAEAEGLFWTEPNSGGREIKAVVSLKKAGGVA